MPENNARWRFFSVQNDKTSPESFKKLYRFASWEKCAAPNTNDLLYLFRNDLRRAQMSRFLIGKIKK
jgi:hypothetical protein